MAAQTGTTEREKLIAAVTRQSLGHHAEYRRYGATNGHRNGHTPPPGGPLADYHIAVDDEPHTPEEVFGLLRWGGQFVYISRDAEHVKQTAPHFSRRGFILSTPPTSIRTSPIRLPFVIPWLGKAVHFFVARKVSLLLPRQITDRFTYHLELDPTGDGACEVIKAVPTAERVVARLKQRFPTVPADVLEKRAIKFTEKIFPIFLTREAAMLKILQRHMPPEYARRVPRLLDLEKDQRGYVRSLRMTWLRNGGAPLSQLEFATQSADLLRVLHDRVGVIHLDLRLDNFVITEAGVGFVDFGSSVRVGEDLKQNPLLNSLFEELMRTSEIQRMLSQMTQSGTVTSPVLCQGRQRVDKAVDFFYLAVQVNQPLRNPDLAGLVRYDPQSEEARAIKEITDEVLRPHDVNNPAYRSASDLYRAITRLASHG